MEYIVIDMNFCMNITKLRKKDLNARDCASPNVIKFCELMSTTNHTTFKNPCKFISKIYSIAG